MCIEVQKKKGKLNCTKADVSESQLSNSTQNYYIIFFMQLGLSKYSTSKVLSANVCCSVCVSVGMHDCACAPSIFETDGADEKNL